MIGWTAKQYLFEKNLVAYTHPEMFDEKGNVIPDEILAVRFENEYDYDYEEDDDNERSPDPDDDDDDDAAGAVL